MGNFTKSLLSSLFLGSQRRPLKAASLSINMVWIQKRKLGDGLTSQKLKIRDSNSAYILKGIE